MQCQCCSFSLWLSYFVFGYYIRCLRLQTDLREQWKNCHRFLPRPFLGYCVCSSLYVSLYLFRKQTLVSKRAAHSTWTDQKTRKRIYAMHSLLLWNHNKNSYYRVLSAYSYNSRWFTEVAIVSPGDSLAYVHIRNQLIGPISSKERVWLRA